MRSALVVLGLLTLGCAGLGGRTIEADGGLAFELDVRGCPDDVADRLGERLSDFVDVQFEAQGETLWVRSADALPKRLLVDRGSVSFHGVKWSTSDGGSPPGPPHTLEGEDLVIEPLAAIEGQIASAEVETTDYGDVVALRFTDEGGRAFHEMSKAFVNKRIAIVVDGTVLSAPRVMEPIPGGRVQISLGWNRTREARELAQLLDAPSLGCAPVLLSESAIPPL